MLGWFGLVLYRKIANMRLEVFDAANHEQMLACHHAALRGRLLR